MTGWLMLPADLARRAGDGGPGFPAVLRSATIGCLDREGYRLMRWMLAAMAVVSAAAVSGAVVSGAAAQPDEARAGGATFRNVRTYWVQKRDFCQPMAALEVTNASSGDIGPIEIRLDVVDMDKGSVFASGVATLAAGALGPGAAKRIVIGGDHDITAHDCQGDMHEAPFSAIHFAVSLSARAGQDGKSVVIVRGATMTDEVVDATDRTD